MDQVYREIEQHIPELRRYARALTRNSSAAEDLVQECLTRALAKSHLFRPGTNLRAWLFTILHNQHVSELRRQGQTGLPVDPDDAAGALATGPAQDRRLVMKAVHAGLRRLPDKQRALILLIAVRGLSYEQVADRFDLPVGTVKSRVSRGRTVLRQALEGRMRPTGEAHGRAMRSAGGPHRRTAPSFRVHREAARRAAA